MTECNQDRFEFASTGTRQIVADFSGGTITTDAGSLLLKEADLKMNLLTRFSQCFTDRRSPLLIEHTLEQMLRQRVYGLALGYEDLNDHDLLRQDPLLGVMAGKAEPGTDLLAGKSTLNRMELGTGAPSRYKKITFWRDSVDELLVNIFLEAHPVAPAQIVLDIDTTDMAIHGNRKTSIITATTSTTATCRCTSFVAIMCGARDCGPAASGRQWEAGKKSSALSNRFASAGRKWKLSCAAIRGSARTNC